VQEYLLRIETAGGASISGAAAIKKELEGRGFVPIQAWLADSAWWVRVGAPEASSIEQLCLTQCWKRAEARKILECVSWLVVSPLRTVGDVFTFALLLWPAVVGLFVLADEGWQLALKIALIAWLGVMHLVAYRQERGAFFGNSMLMLSGCVAGFWWTHPGPSMYLWLFVILVGVYAAVRGALRGSAPSTMRVSQMEEGSR
jgi:hypothetical protein